MNDLLWRALRTWSSWFMVYVNIHLMREKLGRYARLLHGTLLDIGAGDKPYRHFFNVDKYIGVNALNYYLSNVPIDVSQNTDVWIDGSLPLPFESDAFDSVVCFQVLSVIHKPEEFFRELARLLKPGGYLLLTTNFLYPKWDKDDWFRHTDVCLRGLAEVNDFDVIAIESFGGWLTTVHCLIMRYVRDYPHRIHQASTPARKLWHYILYICWLIALPALAMAGQIVFLMDRSLTQDYIFTMNLLVVATRRMS